MVSSGPPTAPPTADYASPADDYGAPYGETGKKAVAPSNLVGNYGDTVAASARITQKTGKAQNKGSEIKAADGAKARGPGDMEARGNENIKALGDSDLLSTGLDPLDKGANELPTTLEKIDVDDQGEDTGPTPEMVYPLLDIEPNTITSLNTEEYTMNLKKRVSKPRIDYRQLAYEQVVARLQGHKRAYNSSTYGYLTPEIDIAFAPKPNKRKVYKIDPESLQDSLSEAPFGFKKPNEAIAAQFKREMRTFVMPNSHYHGGPLMLKRGLNQFRNEAIRKELRDPNPEEVEVQTQNARDAFVLNGKVLYASETTKLQFKRGYNAARTIPDSMNTGHIRPPNTWFGIQAGTGTGTSRGQTLGFDAPSGQGATQGNPQQDATQQNSRGTFPGMFHGTRPSQRVSANLQKMDNRNLQAGNVGTYAVFSNVANANRPMSQVRPTSTTVAGQTAYQPSTGM